MCHGKKNKKLVKRVEKVKQIKKIAKNILKLVFIHINCFKFFIGFFIIYIYFYFHYVRTSGNIFYEIIIIFKFESIIFSLLYLVSRYFNGDIISSRDIGIIYVTIVYHTPNIFILIPKNYFDI